MSNKKENYLINKKSKIIVIDGIIGAGKTTLGDYISKVSNTLFYQELPDEGQERLTQNMLDLFYEAPSRWSGMTQVMFLTQRFKILKEADQMDAWCLFDRSIYGDEIFAYNLYKRNEMTKEEFSIYQLLLKTFIEETSPPHLLIYLDVDVNTAMKRIEKRDRSTESSGISKDYMIDLKNTYDAWFSGFDLCPKIKIDNNFDGSPEEIFELLKPHLKGFINYD
jgi:deoxyadenosine/deoxycytidine kinase